MKCFLKFEFTKGALYGEVNAKFTAYPCGSYETSIPETSIPHEVPH